MSEEEKNVNFIFKRNILGVFTFDFFNTAALKMPFSVQNYIIIFNNINITVTFFLSKTHICSKGIKH